MGTGLLLPSLYFMVKKSAKLNALIDVVKEHHHMSPIKKKKGHNSQNVKRNLKAV